MVFSRFQFFFSAPLFFPPCFTQENHVYFTETPEFHIYSVDLPGLRKDEIRVEVEDSRYLIIKTQAVDGKLEPARRFMKKLRLPLMIDANGISAGYEDGVLRVTVPKSFVNRRIRINPAHLPDRYEVLAPAA